jgi:hypothetical protein
MGKSEQAFNRSGLSRFLNSLGGRAFRVAMGLAFLAVGIVYRHHWLGMVSIVWSVFPLSAGAFDVCYISLALGGPFTGRKIRANYQIGQSPSSAEAPPTVP